MSSKFATMKLVILGLQDVTIYKMH